GDEEERPGEGPRRLVPGALGDLHDVPVTVLRTRIDLVCRGLATGAAVAVVGAGHVDAPGRRVRLHVLRPVHLGGARPVRGDPGVHEDL
ncbi:hypothetical protein ABE10_00500, partial [Bacillus toyonensis]|nr:hypothetical protein [Bacillus toyonensis]